MRFLTRVLVQLVIAVVVYLALQLFFFGEAVDARLLIKILVFGLVFALVNSVVDSWMRRIK